MDGSSICSVSRTVLPYSPRGSPMNTRISAISLSIALTAVFFMYAAPAQAQATRTWVSGVGDDVNPCSRTAPCKTFAGAISKTATNGEINCIDSGGFGAVTITKSITIDCKNVEAGIAIASSSSGVIINYDSFAAGRKAVRLRGLDLNGLDAAAIGVRIIGTGMSSAGSAVYIEDSIIDGNFGAAARGVSDERSGGGELVIANTVIRNFGTSGILVAGTNPLKVLIDNVRVHNGTDTFFGNGSVVMIRHSTFSGNSGFGIYAEGTATVNVSDSTVSHNGGGVSANGATVRLSNVDVTFNDFGLNGTILSHGNNRITGNTNSGVAPTLLSPSFQ
jgi:hypothetical protein